MKNKTFRLFVSSTFNDFQLERNLLHDEVFPKVKAFCNKEGYEFQIIDLRWGIYTEATLNHKTMPICLDEVKRCRDFSPRPSFLAMIGERYGWVPLPPSISKNELDKILASLTDSEASYVLEWYLLDANEEGGMYYLKPRTDSFIEDSVWAETENKLRDILIKGAKSANFSSDLLIKYTASATEQEIISGFLGNEDLAENGIVLIREGFPNADSDQTKIKELKGRVFDLLDRTNHLDRLIKLDYSESYKKLFVDSIYQTLISSVRAEIRRLNKYEESTGDKTRILPYYTKDSVYCGYTYAFDAIQSYVNDENSGIMYICGSSGTGKTTLLAKYLHDYDCSCSFAFYGEGPWACSIYDTIEHISDDITDKYGAIESERFSNKTLSEILSDAIKAIPKRVKRHLIVIDGIDMFSDLSLVKENFLPQNLPKNVRIIISSAKEEIIDRFYSLNDHRITLKDLNPTESSVCFDTLMSHRHRFLNDEEQKRLVNRVLSKGCSPLQAKLLVNLASKWVSGKKIDSLPDSSIETATKYIRSSYEEFGHDKELALYCMALISASPLGLSESDILSMLIEFAPVKEKFISESKHDRDFNTIPFAIWSRLYYDLSDCLTMSFYESEIIIKFTHNIFPLAMRESFPEYCERAKEILKSYITKRIQSQARYAKTLLLLLFENQKYDELAEIITNPDFANFYIMRDGLVHMAELLSSILGHVTDPALVQKVKRFLSCLNNYWPMLRRYKDSFISCAYESGLLLDKEPVIYSLDKASHIASSSSIAFNYSKSAKISYSSDAKYYAVFDKCYVYICNGESNLEYLKIFVTQDKEDKTEILDVFWLRPDLIAVFTYQNKIIIYRIKNDTTTQHCVLDGNAEKPYISLLKNSTQVVFCKEKKVASIDLSTGSEIYEIDLPEDSYLCTDESNRLIIYSYEILDKPKYDIYDATTGRLISNERFNTQFSKYFPRACGVLQAINDRKFLHVMDKKLGYLVYDYTTKEHTYIHPPTLQEIKQNIVSDKFLLTVYDNGIFAIDINYFAARFLPFEGIKYAAWHIKNRSVAIISEDRKLSLVNLSDFTIADQAFTNKLNLFYGSFHTVKKIFDYDSTFGTLPTRAPEDYSTWFSSFYTEYENLGKVWDEKVPTLISVSPSGKYAVAYEHLNAVAVNNAEGDLLFMIDDLSFNMKNNLLSLAFSPDSSYLLIWSSGFIRVVSVNYGRVVCSLSLANRPAVDVCFKDSKTLKVTLMNQLSYEANLNHFLSFFSQSLPIKCYASGEKRMRDFAYHYNHLEKNSKRYSIIDKENFSKLNHISAWLVQDRAYIGKEKWLLYKNGRFYLNGDEDLVFESNRLYDFIGSAKDCIATYPSIFETFITEKNDISSSLYEFKRSNHLLLVSKRLNSVILFNIDEMKVVSAYKSDKKILASVFDEENKTLTIYTGNSTTEKLKINI